MDRGQGRAPERSRACRVTWLQRVAPVARHAAGGPAVGRALAAGVLTAALLCAAAPRAAAQSTMDQIQRYRQMLEDANPAELLVERGAALWRQPRGPNAVSLEGCDLGLGPGVVKGALGRLPRYFADARRVMDVEARLVFCQVALQGFPEDELTRAPFSATGQRQTDHEALIAFVAEASRGTPIQVPQQHPLERAAYERGRFLFHFRAGPYGYACATCHAGEGRRMRLQELANFDRPDEARRAFAAWPAYRISQGAVRTLQWRIYDCFRQQRFPEMRFASQASIDLITYMGVQASGGALDAPGIRR
jgi:sulfur-oxidizing protein SoxA